MVKDHVHFVCGCVCVCDVFLYISCGFDGASITNTAGTVQELNEI